MINENCWIYNEKCLEESPEGFYGFIYKITDDKGFVYFGKKAFAHRKKVKLSKKARIGTRKRTIIKTVDSKWMNYWGSSKNLLNYIKEKGNTKGFKREVIKLCFDKSSLNYWETYYLMINEVLFNPGWNENIQGKYFKNKIHK